jgi:hypothetical protein
LNNPQHFESHHCLNSRCPTWSRRNPGHYLTLSIGKDQQEAKRKGITGNPTVIPTSRISKNLKDLKVLKVLKDVPDTLTHTLFEGQSSQSCVDLSVLPCATLVYLAVLLSRMCVKYPSLGLIVIITIGPCYCIATFQSTFYLLPLTRLLPSISKGLVVLTHTSDIPPLSYLQPPTGI